MLPLKHSDHNAKLFEKKKGYMLDRVAILILSILVNILSRMSLADSAKENMEFAKEVYSSLL